MTVDLLFRDALGPQPGGDVRLVFGGTGSAPPDPPTYPDPSPGLLRAAWGLPWRRGVPLAPAVAAAPWGKAQAVATVPCAAPWGRSDRVSQHRATPWGRTAAAGASVSTPWSTTAVRSAAVRLPWAQTVRAGTGLVLPWRTALQRSGAVGLPWRAGLPFVGRVLAPWHRGQAASARVIGSAQAGRPAVSLVQATWHKGRLVESVGGPWTPDPLVPVPPVPCYQPDPGNDVLLLFREAYTGLAHLLFACRRAALVVVPIRRVYMLTNTTTLTRVSDGAPITCFGFSLSLDRDSWAWGFSASVDAGSLPLLQPEVPGEPVELEAVVNGLPFRVIARSFGRDRQFNGAAVRVDGVGHTAVLDAPFSAETVFSAASALTAQQLLDQSLPTGWTADWQLTPWLVPGGLWSHQGTPASAAIAIAAAAGGYVQPHPSAKSLQVLPAYPVAPWAWGSVTPDLELPAAVVTRESIEWLDRPRYNGVYVSGTATGGVLRLVKRTGTAGDVLAPMVTDRLITHNDAARQRGLAVLGDTGSQAWVTLGLPVLPSTSVVMPGKWVRYVDGALARLGLVRGVRVDVTAGNGDTEPTEVWQSIRLETRES